MTVLLKPTKKPSRKIRKIIARHPCLNCIVKPACSIPCLKKYEYEDKCNNTKTFRDLCYKNGIRMNFAMLKYKVKTKTYIILGT